MSEARKRLRLKRGFKRRTTARGFGIIDFRDDNDTACNVQKSSSAMFDCIWLGAAEIGLKRLTPGKGWEDVPLAPGACVANNRMHLSQRQVAALLPILQHFAETGELP